MKYTLIFFALLFVSQFSYAQTIPLEGKESAIELEKEINAKKGEKVKIYSSGSVKNTPLYIVEGIPVNEKILNGLNPNTIQRIEVLKNENATAIYGDSGKNGVVIVRLKKKYVKKFKKEQEKK